MADANRGNRPISPHIGIYRIQFTMLTSGLHRITGVALTGAALLVVWWLLAAASGPAYFALADGLLTSVLGQVVLIGALWALWYHFCNGIRHLFWDAGRGLELGAAYASAIAVFVGSVALTALTLLLA